MKREIVESTRTNVKHQHPSLWAIVVVLLTACVGATDQPAAAQSPCGQVQTVPANSPPFQFTDSSFAPACCGLSFQDYLTSYNVTSAQPWATVTSIGPLSGPLVTSRTLTFDVTGLSPGTYCAQFPDSVSAVSTAPSCPGCILAGSVTEQHQIVVTATPAVLLVDPVPDLIAGNAVKTSSQLQNLLTKGRTVSGIAADGVTQIVVRVDTNYPAHQFALTLIDDQGLSGASIIPSEDGALDLPGNSGFPSGQLTITAGVADSNGMAHAFAVYRAPIDFARPSATSASGFKSGTCQGVSKTDDQLACRAVSLQIQDITANTTLPAAPITIVRPPVFLIHGLWGDWNGWNTFSPLVKGKKSVDRRFHVERVSYDWDVGSLIKSSNPTYTASMSTAKANSLGVKYVTPFVLTQVAKAIGNFKNGDNPVKLTVAAVQADVVAHSMGGVVTRTLPLVAGFFSNTFGQGTIHKVISVDVPHLGSPLAALLLDSSADCTREILGAGGYFSFKSVNFSNAPNTTESGAVGDMVNSPPSPALTAISGAGTHPLPTALIAGVYTNFTSLDCTTNLIGYPCPAYYIRSKCGPQGDLMASKFNGTSWPLIFGAAGNNSNDAVVSQSSQLNGLAITSGVNGFIYSGLVHSPTLTKLSFTGTSVLDSASAPNPVADQVIVLLNTPYTQSVFQSLNP